jgi:hypothetical protein
VRTSAKTRQLEKSNKELIEENNTLRKDVLLQFAKHKEAEYHNSRAERTICRIVIFKKLSFGSRTPEGDQYHAILTSVLETCRLKGKNVLVFLNCLT